MERFVSRGRCCRFAACVGLATLGCIDTDLDTGSPGITRCAARVIPPIPRNALVQVTAQLGIGVTYCSGVVVAPRMVATAAGCVTGFNDVDSTDPRPKPATSLFGIATASRDYDQTCARELDWSLVEDGQFESPLGRVLEPGAVTVEVIEEAVVEDANDDERSIFDVERVFASGTTSNCRDALAIVVLTSPMSVTPLPLRLEEASQIGEAVHMLGYCVTEEEGAFVVSEIDSRIDAITLDRGTPAAPPRSLLLQQNLSIFGSGGAVVSAASGALVGIVGSGNAAGCGEASSGTTIAFRVAPFRRLFADAARFARNELVTELIDPNDATDLGACLTPASGLVAGSDTTTNP